MTFERDGFFISTEPGLLDLDFICRGLKKSVLGTRDAHGLYEKFGYVRTEMMRRSVKKAASGGPDETS
jgi:hypothetical protein